MKPIAPSQIAQASQRLGTRFPKGLEAFLTTYGEGEISGWVHLYSPREVVKYTSFLREFLSDLLARGEWFWDRRGVLPPERAAASVSFGHTIEGDDILFHPDDPDEIFARPRHSHRIFRAGRGLDEALDWLFLSGKLTRKIPRRVFLPHTRRRRNLWPIGLPYSQIRRRLLALGIHDDVTEDDTRHGNLELLVRDIGGTISLSGPDKDDRYIRVQIDARGNEIPEEPGHIEPTDLGLDCDPGCRSPKLKQFLAFAAELAGE